MCAWRAALFLWQPDGFSFDDAHGFNRNSSSQVAECVWGSEFLFVSEKFTVQFRLSFPLFRIVRSSYSSEALKVIEPALPPANPQASKRAIDCERKPESRDRTPEHRVCHAKPA